MKKAICILRGNNEQKIEEFNKSIRDITDSILEELNPEKLSYTASYEKPPAISIIPFKKSLISIISIYYNEEPSFNFPKNLKGFISSDLLLQCSSTIPSYHSGPLIMASSTTFLL